jgi:hypothetical protein
MFSSCAKGRNGPTQKQWNDADDFLENYDIMRYNNPWDFLDELWSESYYSHRPMKARPSGYFDVSGWR